MDIQEKRIFFQSIFSTEIKPAPDLAHKIYKLQDDSSAIISNRNGWQSRTYSNDELDWMNPVISEMWRAADHFRKLYGVKRDLKGVGYWFNINPKGGYNLLHNHVNSLISAVWYIQTPPNCGNIVFANPTPEQTDWTTMFSMPEEPEITEHNFYHWYEEPSVGKIIFFPSWLRHYVEQNENDQERISVAFNFGV